jgi:hypothetical protein
LAVTVDAFLVQAPSFFSFSFTSIRRRSGRRRRSGSRSTSQQERGVQRNARGLRAVGEFSSRHSLVVQAAHLQMNTRRETRREKSDEVEIERENNNRTVCFEKAEKKGLLRFLFEK